MPAVNFAKHGKYVPQLEGLRNRPSRELRQKLAEAWRREVEVYSGKNITNPLDRLPAFSGIAQRFLSLGMNPPYLAGIWQIDIESELCWKALKPGVRPVKYRAPSFSWASVEAGIQFVPPYNVSSVFELVMAHCEPAYADPFGAVEAGFLKLRSKVVEGKCCFTSTPGLAADAHRELKHSVLLEGVEYPFSADVTDFLGNFGVKQDL